jgi:hypothetical protein
MQQVHNTTGFVYIQAIGGGPIEKIPCSTHNLPKGIKPPSVAQLKQKFPVLKDIELHEPARGGVHLLLGFDNQHLLRSLGDYKTKPSEPSIRRTIWGNTVLWHPEAARWHDEDVCLTISEDETLEEKALAIGLIPHSDQYLSWMLKKSWEIDTAALREPQYGRTRYNVTAIPGFLEDS